MTPTIPKWIPIYLWIVTAMTFGFSLLAYFKPELQFGGWETLNQAGALSLIGPLGLYVARNLATAIMGLYALVNKSTAMIKLFLVMRIATESMDLIHALVGGTIEGAAFPLVMLVIEILAFVQILKAEKS